MNREELPTTPKKLNSWIENHFQIFEGPSRPYFELPFIAILGTPGEDTQVKHYHRVIYLCLGFKGSVEDCCKKAAAHLLACVTREEFVDATSPIFIRTWFAWQEFESQESYLSGRLAFWSKEQNGRLFSSPLHHLPATMCNRAVAPTSYFDPWTRELAGL